MEQVLLLLRVIFGDARRRLPHHWFDGLRAQIEFLEDGLLTGRLRCHHLLVLIRSRDQLRIVSIGHGPTIAIFRYVLAPFDA